MKYIKLVILFSLFPALLFAQKVSRIYNKSGQLIADTSFSIGKLQLKRFIQVEDTLLKQIIVKIHYPEVEREAQIEDSLIVISFTVNKNDSLENFKVEKNMGKGDAGLIKQISWWIFVRNTPVVHGYNAKGVENKEYYLAFRFRLSGGIDGPSIEAGCIVEDYKLPKVDVEEHKSD